MKPFCLQAFIPLFFSLKMLILPPLYQANWYIGYLFKGHVIGGFPNPRQDADGLSASMLSYTS